MSLVELYDALPTLDCRLRCQESCHDIPLLYDERARLGDLGCGTCPLLGAFGQCTAHHDRPLMCRLWGVVENMPCPHGCRPDRMLTVAEGAAIVEVAERVGGGWVNA
jgi:hypothetical protein